MAEYTRTRTTSPIDQMNFKVILSNENLSSYITLGIVGVKGITRKIGNIEYREDGISSSVVKNTPGLIKIGPVTLTGGMLFNLKDYQRLLMWQNETAEYSVTGLAPIGAIDIKIYPTTKYLQSNPMLSTNGWNLKGCTPRDLSITDFDTNGSGFAKFDLVVQPSDILMFTV